MVEYALQEHYWTHIEYFPHNSVSQELRHELAGILRHGQLGTSIYVTEILRKLI